MGVNSSQQSFRYAKPNDVKVANVPSLTHDHERVIDDYNLIVPLVKDLSKDIRMDVCLPGISLMWLQKTYPILFASYKHGYHGLHYVFDYSKKNLALEALINTFHSEGFVLFAKEYHGVYYYSSDINNRQTCDIVVLGTRTEAQRDRLAEKIDKLLNPPHPPGEDSFYAKIEELIGE